MSETIAFGALEIEFDDRVLRPREWTTRQSRWAAELLPDLPAGPVLELCSGAGQIGLLAVAGSQRHLVCVDADPVACDFARANALAAGLADRVDVRNERLEEALEPGELFALVIADPPWVRREETHRFPEDPLPAIDGGADGLDVARSCLRVMARHLRPSGSAVLQVGTAAQVEVLCEDPTVLDGELAVAEVWPQERGVLVRLDRR